MLQRLSHWAEIHLALLWQVFLLEALAGKLRVKKLNRIILTLMNLTPDLQKRIFNKKSFFLQFKNIAHTHWHGQKEERVKLTKGIWEMSKLQITFPISL